MKNLNNYIFEKILISKNTNIKHGANDHIDTLTCCDELYIYLDELWNDDDYWKNISDDPEEAREEFFDDFMGGNRKDCVDRALTALVDNGRLSDEDADKYSNNMIILDFCTEIANLLMTNKFIDVNKIYQKIAF